jgi:hypothetical protein
MTYEQRSQLKPGAFKRRCGVHLETFEQMQYCVLLLIAGENGVDSAN